MAVASPAIVFPTTGWENNLSCVPPLNEERLEFYRSRSTKERCYDRSYNFTVESYVIASMVKTNSSMQRYGISNEPMAAKRYEEVLQTMGHDATVVHCGLLVNPAFPWLGASRDMLVFDSAEASYEVLQIKCPYSLREKKGEELATATFCSELTESGPRLKREDYYYAQLVGQMGVSGLSWGDFVVYGKDFILIGTNSAGQC
ncbi:hypothetical protein HPB49_025229 [Dermacentor silvarum]|uniref:Uncharacterized protein n=1 Tax=Dermacentor silvarum TaxID=543639 RepID=A0ACB8DHJ8_DERSI|nr:hypothetical protein HPB49_025229 [Dermacentor silvarum]